MKKLLQMAALTALAVPMLAVAHGPTRQVVDEKIVINAPIETVWEMVKDFEAIGDWHPEVKQVEMQDAETRVITLERDGDPTVTEQIHSVNEERTTLIFNIRDMSVTETIIFNSQETPYYTFPVSTYRSWMFVKEVDGGTEVRWNGKFYRSFMSNPPVPEGQSDSDAVAEVKAFYIKGLEGLKATLEK